MAKLKLSAPWDTYYQKVNAIFKEDSEVNVIFDEDEYILKIYVDDASGKKADAISALLPERKVFGNVELKIAVIPSNDYLNMRSCKFVLNKDTEEYYSNLFESAFRGNYLFEFVYAIKGVYGFTATYVVFKKKVVQYFNDNIADLNGLYSTLAQDIAKDIFNEFSGVFYCTSAEDNVKESIF